MTNYTWKEGAKYIFPNKEGEREEIISNNTSPQFKCFKPNRGVIYIEYIEVIEETKP